MKLREERALERAAHRVRRDEPDAGHAADTAHGRHEVELCLTHGIGRLVSRSEEGHVEEQPLVRHEPGVGVPEIRESSHEPARAGHQHDRQRDFGHGHRHEPARRAAAGARRARAVVHERFHIAAEQTNRWRKSDDRPGDDEHGERKEQDAPVERHGVEARQLRRADREQRAETQRPDGDSDDRARGRQHHRLREELANQPAPSRAERRAHGHLARPRRAAREQQVGDVHAREEEQQPGRRHDDDQDRPQVADDRVDQRPRDVDAVAVRRGKVIGEAAHDRRHLAFRALDRRPVSQAHEAFLPVVDVGGRRALRAARCRRRAGCRSRAARRRRRSC